MNIAKKITFILVLSILLISSYVYSQDVKLCVWCEFMPYDEVDRYIDFLKKENISLILHISPSDIGNKSLLKVLRKAKEEGVEVRAWFLLPYDKGLYVSEDTVDKFQEFVKKFIKWEKTENLNIKWLVFDCEPTPAQGKELFKYVRENDFVSFIKHLRKNKDPDRFRQTVDRMSQLIDYLHREGYSIAGASNRMLLEGLHSRNITIQSSLRVPFTMLDWDEVSFFVYRYKASQNSYVAMIKRYSVLVKKRFGEKGLLDVGLIGDNRLIPENKRRMELFGGEEEFSAFLVGIDDPKDLGEIIDVIRKYGLYRTNIYSLDGIHVSDYSPDVWLQMQEDNGKEYFTPVTSPKVGLVNSFLQFLYKIFVGRDRTLEKEYRREPKQENSKKGGIRL